MQTTIQTHHQETIEGVTTRFAADPTVLAVIVGGSVAHGFAKPSSDVDIMLIVNDQEFARREASGEMLMYKPEWATYEGGYVDVKVLNMQFLRDAAERGSEPTRWSFCDTFIKHSTLPELQGVIDQITRYPIEEQPAKIRAFYGKLTVAWWFVGEALRHDNLYLLTHATSNLVLYGSRLILAHNQRLYPYHKWLMKEMERIPDKPADFDALADAVLRSPSQASADAFYKAVAEFRDWGIGMMEGFMAFTERNERAWLTGQSDLEDW